ncbi:hypothetical protein [Streptomyces sp. NBC_00019]
MDRLVRYLGDGQDVPDPEGGEKTGFTAGQYEHVTNIAFAA